MAHQIDNSVLVSIIMPLYNAERFVTTALASILQETQLALEVIVVNDASTDGSLQKLLTIRDDRLKILDNQGKGIAAALNTGLAVAKGQFITRCDADDLYPIQRLRRQIDWLNQHPDFGAVCGGYMAIDPKGAPLTRLCSPNTEEITAELRSGVVRTHLCTYAIRAELLQTLGEFRPYFVTAEDVDFQLRLGDSCRVWYVSDIFYQYRVHSASITHTKGSIEREFFDLIAREFQKQRHTSGKDALQRGCPPPPPRQGGEPFTAAQHIQSFLLGEAWRSYYSGQMLQAVTIGMRSALTQPGNCSVWRSLLALLVKSATNRDRTLFRSTLRS